MTFKVIWTDAALADVHDVVEHVHDLAGAASANALASELMSSTRFLADFPRMYQVFPSSIEHTRHIVVRSAWRVLYVVDDASRCCDVMAVVHTSRQV
jgi:plasmid stabilization system protein ParE